jgi:hypothetical protein
MASRRSFPRESTMPLTGTAAAGGAGVHAMRSAGQIRSRGYLYQAHGVELLQRTDAAETDVVGCGGVRACLIGEPLAGVLPVLLRRGRPKNLSELRVYVSMFDLLCVYMSS